MSKGDAAEVLKALREAGFDQWMIVLLIFGGLTLWKGPQYFSAISAHFNAKRKVDGDLARKLTKLNVDIEAKRARAAKAAAAAASKKAGQS